MVTKKGFLKAGIATSVLLGLGSGCAKVPTDANSVMQALLGNGGAGPQFGICVSDADGSGKPKSPPIYCDNSGTALKFVDKKQYVLTITPASGGSYQYNVTMSRIDIVNPPMAAGQTMSAGNNLISAPAPGDYVIKVAAVEGSTEYPARLLQASVACDAPPLSATGLNPSAISVSGAGDNLFNFSSSGIDSGTPGGQAPYYCAWDFNGDGTRDSVFRPCSDAVNNVYVNYIGMRNVGVIVKDSCNMAVSVSKAVNLPAGGLPSHQPGDKSIFIHAVTSNALGTALASAATNNIDYWATNNTGSSEKAVIPKFTYNGNLSTFVIDGSWTYGLPSSLKFGVKLTVTGLNASLGADLSSSSICGQTGPMGSPINNFNCGTSTKLARLDYTTDQAGDAQAPLSLSGVACTSSIGAEILVAQGTPCSPGTDNPMHRETKYTIHVFGTYSCDPVTGSGGSMKVAGTFDGLDFLVDACIGGGGGGGGGIVPVRF